MKRFRFTNNNFYRKLLVWSLIALLLRLAVALPGICVAPERFLRPDSPGYLQPAYGLLRGEGFAIDGTATAIRAPGFSCFALPFLGIGGEKLLAAALILVSTLTVWVIGWSAREFAGERAGLWAAVLGAFNLSAIANAPMMLSDTLFTFLIALQGTFLLLAWKRCSCVLFVASVTAAALGALVKPINSVWLLPALVLLGFLPVGCRKKKIAAGIAAVGIYAVLLCPWMARNAAIGSGFALDTNTGSMYHQNGAMLLAMVRHTDYETEKQTILAELEKEFLDTRRYPDPASRTRYKMSRYRALIAAYPLRWFLQQFQWKSLLPDLPTALELFGATTPDRGTLNVLQTRGVVPAVRHYFAGNFHLLLAALPLLAVHGLLLFAAAGEILCCLRHRDGGLILVLMALALVEYYLFLPGAITVPRYFLPALPFLAVLAGSGLNRLHFQFSNGILRTNQKGVEK